MTVKTVNYANMHWSHISQTKVNDVSVFITVNVLQVDTTNFERKNREVYIC